MATISAAASEGVVSTRAQDLAPINDPVRVDAALAEFHGKMFDLSNAANKAHDSQAEAVAAYLHDQFCFVRQRLDGDDCGKIENPAPYPAFRPDGATHALTIAALREHIARLEDALSEALAHVGRIASTSPTQPARQARQRHAVRVAANIRTLLGKGTASRTEDALRSAQRE